MFERACAALRRFWFGPPRPIPPRRYVIVERYACPLCRFESASQHEAIYHVCPRRAMEPKA